MRGVFASGAGWFAQKRSVRGFTLVELLVVIAIIGILIALLLPAVQAAREAARASQCRNNLKQVSLAAHSFHDANNHLPAGAYCKGTQIGHCHSWLEMLLPFMELGAIFDQIDFTVNNNVGVNPAALNDKLIPNLMCPSDPDAGLLDNKREVNYTPGPGKSLAMSYMPCGGSYSRNGCFIAMLDPNINCIGEGKTWGDEGFNCGSRGNGSPGMFAGGYITYEFRDCTDGLTNTIFFGEQLPIYNSFMMYFLSHGNTGWTNIPPNQWKYTDCPKSPDERSCTNEMAGYNSLHSGGIHVSMSDCSVLFLDEAIDYKVYNYLGNKNDGQVISDDNFD